MPCPFTLCRVGLRRARFRVRVRVGVRVKGMVRVGLGLGLGLELLTCGRHLPNIPADPIYRYKSIGLG